MPVVPLILIEELPVAVEDLWALWTDPDKVTRWLAGGSTIDLRVGGTYELNGHLAARDLKEPVGGAIVGLQEEYVLKVAWRLPAEFGTSVRDAAPPTALTVLFQPLGPNRTRLRLEHDGWREGDDWTTALRWQTEVWNSVLAKLKEGKLPI